MRVFIAVIVSASSIALLATARAAPAPPLPAPEVAGGPIGTGGPLVVEGWAPDRRWVALCQAREDTDGDGEIAVHLGYHGDTFGDALAPYIVVGDGPGQRVDAYLGASADGRWLAAVERGRLVLWDTATGGRRDLTALGAAEGPSSPLVPSWGGFEPGGARYLFLAGEGASRAAALVDPLTGDTTPVKHGADALFAAFPLDGGRHAVVFTYPLGARPQLPRTSLAPGGCRGPITSYSTGGGPVNVARSVVGLDGKPAPDGALVIRAGRALVREPGGDLVWVGADGARAPALPVGVGGFVLRVGSGALLVASPVGDHGEAEVIWVADDGRVARTGLRRAAPSEDRAERADGVWSTWEGGRTWLVDMATGAHALGPDEVDVLAAAGGNALVTRRRDGLAAVVAFGSGAVTELAERVAPYAERGAAGSWAYAQLAGGGNVVVDVAAGKVAGVVGGPEAVAISADGYLLAPTVEATARGLAGGPLAWTRPARP
ncbi:MAG: hypothetical protein H6745_26340 [Deltaproteobacteria bacterium]|nr:hypothetical protein [Deltaproteobacteria bacterium]